MNVALRFSRLEPVPHPWELAFANFAHLGVKSGGRL